MGVFSYVGFSLCCVLFFGVVLSHADTTLQNDTISTICPNTSNPLLCWQMLKSVRNLDSVSLTNYTLNFTRTSAIECLHYAQGLEAKETVNLELKKRYSYCSKSIKSTVTDIEVAQEYMGYGSYIVADLNTMGAFTDSGDCLNSFNQPPPEPSALQKSVKNLNDICEIACHFTHFIAGDDA
ncbi:pectinesterase inhibitor-like [Cucurbita moschata]|uniref:Pectinesterase inhibitor-like n=1 Tax=Cucurbita moschata TaxID=3662 RepID=A0A6J1H4N5_CUCMO|nr:pectinesterase inhibitor-like [Cucurbita moschata]